jgi:hypothetical protein
LVFNLRSSRLGVSEERSTTDEQMEGEEGMIRGRCIPGRKKQHK